MERRKLGHTSLVLKTERGIEENERGKARERKGEDNTAETGRRNETCWA